MAENSGLFVRGMVAVTALTIGAVVVTILSVVAPGATPLELLVGVPEPNAMSMAEMRHQVMVVLIGLCAIFIAVRIYAMVAR